jgi:hypothetical protein
MAELQTSTGARFERGTPRLLTKTALVVVCGYGVVLMLPVLLSLLAVSVLPIGAVTLLLPLLTLGVTTFFLPWGFGNGYIRRLARSLPQPEADSFLVQLTLTPRLRSGLRAMIEDADDVGWLTIGESALVFCGDALKFTIPLQQIAAVKAQSIGLRGLFVYPRLALRVAGLTDFQTFAVADRSSACLPSARKANRRLHQQLAGKMIRPASPEAAGIRTGTA